MDQSAPTMPSPDPKLVQETMLREAAVTAAALARLGTITDTVAYSCLGAGVMVTVSVTPIVVAKIADNDCARDILSVLLEANERWSTTRILAELSQRGMAHGEGTVARVLAELHAARYLGNSRKTPRGYWHPARFPHDVL